MVLLVCPICNKEFYRYKSQIKNAKRHVCGMECRKKLYTGDGNPRWNGGKTLMKDGRTLIYDPDNPNAKAIGGLYILEYRLIAERKIGRRLLDNEVVHHINGDATDNREENLEVITQSEHALLHSYDYGMRSKLTKEEADQIKEDERSSRKIATDYGISSGYVRRIKKHGIRRPANDIQF